MLCFPGWFRSKSASFEIFFDRISKIRITRVAVLSLFPKILYFVFSQTFVLWSKSVAPRPHDFRLPKQALEKCIEKPSIHHCFSLRSHSYRVHGSFPTVWESESAQYSQGHVIQRFIHDPNFIFRLDIGYYASVGHYKHLLTHQKFPFMILDFSVEFPY